MEKQQPDYLQKREAHRKRQVAEERTCRDCHVQFAVTVGEVEYYQERALELPKRCKACRQAKKARQQKYGLDTPTNILKELKGDDKNNIQPCGD